MTPKFNRYYYENVGEILYHGSDREFSEIHEITKGLWFTTELDNELMNYYGGRGGGIIKCLFTPSKPVLDLTDFDVDEKIHYHDVGDFITDVLADFPDLYKSDIEWKFVEENEPNYDDIPDDDIYGNYNCTRILNWLLERYIIPSNKYSAIRINEAGHETVCVLDKKDLKRLP